MIIDIISALPEIVRGPLGQSIPKRAVDKKLAEFRVHDLRDFTHDKHRQVDDYLFGGGAGMLLKPEPVFECIESVLKLGVTEGCPVDEVIYLTPDGDRLTQSIANELSLKNHVVLLAGHYKGVDQRIRDELITREISIGDYVVSGGELPALVLVDAMIRLLPGVLGDATSALSDSFQDTLLDAPSYTRPSVFRGMAVPDVLRSGDHEKISEWRENMRVQKTKIRRPDLLSYREGESANKDQ